MKIKSFLKDVGGASRVTKLRGQTLNNASSKNLYIDPINATAKALHPGPIEVVCTKVEEVSPTAKKYTFAPTNGVLPIFEAGQYVSFDLDIDGTKTTRPYSICSAPYQAQGENPFFEVTIRNGKKGTGYVSIWFYENVKEGDKFIVNLPFGHFNYEELRDSNNILALAGGSGITPFYSMAQEIANGTLDVNLTILYGSVSHKDIILEKELKEITSKTDKVKFINVISGEGEELQEGDEKGFISRELIKKYSVESDPTNAKTSYFVCGPLVMYQFVEKELKALNVPLRRIRMEVFGAPRDISQAEGYPKENINKVFKLTVRRGIDEVVIDAKACEPLAVALERAGIKNRTRCRSGECGFCRSKVVSGEFFVPKVGDGRRAADKRFNYVHACSTYPLSDIFLEIPIL